MPKPRTPLAAIIPVVGLLLILATPIAIFWYQSHKIWTNEVQRSQDDLDRQLSSLRSGKEHSVYLYDTSNTDSLIEQLSGMPEVESLDLEMTDATGGAIQHVVTLPKLKRFRIYGWVLEGEELGSLHGTSIERLELINSGVTDDGLKHLSSLPKLEVLHIFFEPRPDHTDLSDRGLEHIAKLSTLRELYINSGWASPGALKRLQEALPDCTILIDKDPPRE
jgi:hypothetical protein